MSNKPQRPWKANCYHPGCPDEDFFLLTTPLHAPASQFVSTLTRALGLGAELGRLEGKADAAAAARHAAAASAARNAARAAEGKGNSSDSGSVGGGNEVCGDGGWVGGAVETPRGAAREWAALTVVSELCELFTQVRPSTAHAHTALARADASLARASRC